MQAQAREQRKPGQTRNSRGRIVQARKQAKDEEGRTKDKGHIKSDNHLQEPLSENMRKSRMKNTRERKEGRE